MASLFELLAAPVKSQQQYREDDPFYRGGLAALQMGVTPETNSEAIWAPAIQGLLSGSLLEYGKRRANEAAYSDISGLLGSQGSGPLTQTQSLYSSPSAPPGWSYEKGRTDLIREALSGQLEQQKQLEKIKQEASIKKALIPQGMILDTETGTASPIPGYLDNFEEREKLKGKNNPRSTNIKVDTGLGQQASREWADEISLANRARELSARLEEVKPNYLQLGGAKLYSALDKEGLASEIRDTADMTLRSRTGAAAPVQEKKELQKIVSGDFTAGYQRITQLLNKFADRTEKAVIKETEVADALREGGTQGVRDLIKQGSRAPQITQKYKASDLAAQGYVKTDKGWVKP